MKKLGRLNLLEETICTLECNCGWNISIGGEDNEDLEKLKKLIEKEFPNPSREEI